MSISINSTQSSTSSVTTSTNVTTALKARKEALEKQLTEIQDNTKLSDDEKKKRQEAITKQIDSISGALTSLSSTDSSTSTSSTDSDSSSTTTTKANGTSNVSLEEITKKLQETMAQCSITAYQNAGLIGNLTQSSSGSDSTTTQKIKQMLSEISSNFQDNLETTKNIVQGYNGILNDSSDSSTSTASSDSIEDTSETVSRLLKSLDSLA